ncbi:maleylpyruvate isomerase family mycothiol-dependent enzyme [Amycolatopsis sp. YIM 10]|uniref:maleylpyruvate isomerase family mycothiol-dependent enzyme n=1 Tax=Amycolatopsis sp. YIM 10 TaxID=2653857 RepID=UPI0012902669|nr:maleylpyruvate isomerase family mycothiol-dependent enzyme [Amycolatopsis sp. YIM 10]QFU91703.1 mycothiol-dependent maleylpyruvate isomerase [Amycolatopsis sp. YIM 10]
MEQYEIRDQVLLVRGGVERLLSTIETLTDTDITAPSRLPDWTRAHVLSHLARSADSRTGLLVAARDGVVGRQYESEQSRAQDIETGATRPPSVIRRDVNEAFDRFFPAVAQHPPDRWDAPGEWLGVGESPVRRVVPSMRREVEYHHVDLAASYRPEHWPADFVRTQLASVIDSMKQRPDAPAITLDLPGRTIRFGNGESCTVSGDAADLLAWLTGRADGRSLRTTPPGPPPTMPPLA